MGRLDGKTVLVIGGAQGIGRGCALAAASEGANLVVGDVSADDAQATAADARSRGARTVGMAVDVVEGEQVDAMVAAALAEFGAIDGLVNTAFLKADVVPLAEMSLDTLLRELQVDVVGCVRAMQAVYPHLRGKGGSIVNFSSGAGILGSEGRGGYSAAKAAIRGLSRTAALEWGVDNVRVNSVCPFSLSPSLQASIDAGTLDRTLLESTNPLRRIGDPELDIAPGVVFLLSDDARYVTGQTVALDGGVLSL
jgi:NAD(P)-dependent dehydrogenase (short-subunit alcohol dehydrogenase family)